MYKLKIFLFFILNVFLISCNKNDGSEINNDDFHNNYINYYDSDWEMNAASISEGSYYYFNTSIDLFNISINNLEQLHTDPENYDAGQIDRFYFGLNYLLTLSEGETYNLEDLEYYGFLLNSTALELLTETMEEQRIYALNSDSNQLKATSATITILSYDIEFIELKFTFIRIDGEKISGYYKGEYLYEYIEH